MVTHFSILTCEIPWTEEPGELQSMRSQELDMTQQLNNNSNKNSLSKRTFWSTQYSLTPSTRMSTILPEGTVPLPLLTFLILHPQALPGSCLSASLIHHMGSQSMPQFSSYLSSLTHSLACYFWLTIEDTSSSCGGSSSLAWINLHQKKPNKISRCSLNL